MQAIKSRTGSVHHAQSPESYVRLQGRRRRREARGFRLCPRNRLSVRRLRTLLGLVGRYVRLLVRKLATSRGGCARRSGSRRVLVVVAGTDSKVPAPIVRSNSFYAQAVADCLEFIKRNSVPVVEDYGSAGASARSEVASLRLEQGQDGRRNGTRKTM